jgi:O-antigen ligase
MPVYAGATINPNFLGAIAAMSLPLLVWGFYRNRTDRRARLLWLVLLAAFLVVLYLTSSRAAYLIAFGIGLGVLATVGIPRRIFAVSAIGWAALLIVLIAPEAARGWIERNIYKQQMNADTSVFNSRSRVWQDSYEAAEMGGWAGLGYGISANADPQTFSTSFTTGNYGREKGNSQLAIVEETGLTGLGLYLLLLVALFWPLISTMREPAGDSRVLLGLVTGTLAGMLGQSLLEGWWVAPGSPEFIYFWTIAGAAMGIARMIRMRRPAAPVAPRLAA